MVWQMRSKLRSILSSMEAIRTSLVSGNFLHSSLGKWSPSTSGKFDRVNERQVGSLPLLKRNPFLKLEDRNEAKPYSEPDFFEEMRQRFLSFKQHNYLKKLEHIQALAEVQTPKFMVIACADSRVCPSNILGLQPGETFMIRNVANLVPPVEYGPSETNAALQFAVNTLEVENILVIGHSNCGGIQALMSMQDNENSSCFTEQWVVNAKIAKLETKAEAANLNFDQQCRHCEKVSINRSLLNLLTYPWIEERVRKQLLSLHGGYYDLLNCTFEKWTLDYKRDIFVEDEGRFSVKDHSFWC